MTPVAIHLPGELVEFIDQQVAHGSAGDRAAAIVRALRRERRRAIAARDAAILACTVGDADFDRSTIDASTTPLDID